MKRLVIAGFVGQLASDAPDSVETIEIDAATEAEISHALATGHVVAKGFGVVPYDSKEYAEANAKFRAAVAKNVYLAAKTKAAKDAMKAESEMSLAEKIERRKNAELGFVNLHKTDKLDGRGDGKWYSFESGKTQHQGDPAMTSGEAVAQGIEVG